MPITDMLIPVEKVISVRPDQTVEEGMKILDEKGLRSLPVLNEEGQLLGMFSTQVLLKNLLPVSVTMEDGLQRLDFVIGAAPGVSKRLVKLKPVLVETLLEKNVIVLHPQMPTWEAIRLIVRYGSPLPVIDEKDGRFIGLVTEQTVIKKLDQITD